MNKLTVFNHVSVDGFFAGPNDDIDWFQSVHDDEWNRYTRQASVGDRGALMFGRTTYEMMRSFWPTPAAHQLDPIIAKVMMKAQKSSFLKVSVKKPMVRSGKTYKY